MTEDGFVIGFDADGGVARKPVADMTAAEVLAALEIANGMTDHMKAAAERVDAADADAARIAQHLVREAARRHLRLMKSILVVIPEWAASGLELSEALAKWWPRGRS